MNGKEESIRKSYAVNVRGSDGGGVSGDGGWGKGKVEGE